MKTVLKIVLPLLLLAAGVMVMMRLVGTRPVADRKEPELHATLVDAVTLRPTRHTASVTAMGTVRPAETVVVMPEVSGRLIELHSQILPGGRLAKGDVIARIDPREYELAVEQQRASVARARFEIKLERGRRTVAEREWELLERDVATTRAGRTLALRKPHLENARASLAGSEAGLELAQLRVERTTIRAPFDAMVREDSVDVGQLVGPQTKLATLVGTGRLWVRVAVPVSELRWLRLPGADGEGGAVARIIQEAGDDLRYERAGRVVRLLGDLDPAGRMARVLVEVENPLETGGAYPEIPLFIDAYVRVQLEGRTLENVYVVPRTALRDGDRVWLIDAESRLVVRAVDVARWSAEEVFVRGGLAPEERLIVSRIASPVPGMALQVRGEPSPDERRTPGDEPPPAETAAAKPPDCGTEDGLPVPTVRARCGVASPGAVHLPGSPEDPPEAAGEPIAPPTEGPQP